jgi:hypothetical protein
MAPMNDSGITPKAAAAAVSNLALMAFFPGDPDTRVALMNVLMSLVDTKEHLDWLIERALKLYARWPGVAELRALYCSRYPPKDGAEAYSEIYESGFPHESPAATYVTPAGAPVSNDATIDAVVRKAAKLKAMPAPRASRNKP